MLYKNTSGLFRMDARGFGQIHSMRVRTAHGLRSRHRLSYTVMAWTSPELIGEPELLSVQDVVSFELDLAEEITDIPHLEYLCIQHALEQVLVHGPEYLGALHARVSDKHQGLLQARCSFRSGARLDTVLLRELCVQREYYRDQAGELQHQQNRISYAAHLIEGGGEDDVSAMEFLVNDTGNVLTELAIPNHLYEAKDLVLAPEASQDLLAPCSTLQLYRRFAEHYRHFKSRG